MHLRVDGKRLLALELRQWPEALAHAASKPASNAIEVAP
jgi:hypothetical protein